MCGEILHHASGVMKHYPPLSFASANQPLACCCAPGFHVRAWCCARARREAGRVLWWCNRLPSPPGLLAPALTLRAQKGTRFHPRVSNARWSRPGKPSVLPQQESRYPRLSVVVPGFLFLRAPGFYRSGRLSAPPRHGAPRAWVSGHRASPHSFMGVGHRVISIQA